MDAKDIVEIRFTGENISPETLKAKELGGILESVEDTIASTLVTEHPNISKEDVVIALVKIGKGSVVLALQPQQEFEVKQAFKTIVNAITSQDYSKLPARAINGLKNIQSFTKKKKIDAELWAISDNTEISAFITPDTKIQQIPIVLGKTTIYGKVITVGGKDPTVKIQLLNGHWLTCSINESLAKDLALRLYTLVGLEGVAKWDVKGFEIQSFNAKKITPFTEPKDRSVIDELSILTGKYFADIDDVSDYVHKIRSD